MLGSYAGHRFDDQGSGVSASVNKQKSKNDRAARRKPAMPPSESLTDPAPAPPLPATDTAPAIAASLPCANGDEETALARLADDGGPPAPPAEAESPPLETPFPADALSLEQRVRRLEEAVTLLQGRRAAVPRASAVPADARPADRPPEASPVPSPPPATAIRLDVAKLQLGPAAPVATAAPASFPGITHPSTRGSLLWLLWDTWAEARAIVRMFVDPRYQLPWSARVLPMVLLAAILISHYWVPFSSIPLLGGILVKLVDLLLAFLLFKWLGHEARRYRQTSPDLPANLRL